jgi:hypothetical protein
MVDPLFFIDKFDISKINGADLIIDMSSFNILKLLLMSNIKSGLF